MAGKNLLQNLYMDKNHPILKNLHLITQYQLKNILLMHLKNTLVLYFKNILKDLIKKIQNIECTLWETSTCILS